MTDTTALELWREVQQFLHDANPPPHYTDILLVALQGDRADIFFVNFDQTETLIEALRKQGYRISAEWKKRIKGAIQEASASEATMGSVRAVLAVSGPGGGYAGAQRFPAQTVRGAEG
jgi:hypothetical protein